MHEQGKPVNVWTVNNKKDMKIYIKMGVDGIITNYPDYGKALADTWR